MLSEQIKATLKDACQKLTGPKKRAFMAKVAEDYFDGSARKTETHLGWGRQSIQLGLHERRTGILCKDNYQARGNHKIEEKQPELARMIHLLVDGQTQADPQMKTRLNYTKVSAQAVRNALIEKQGYQDEELPTRQSIGTMMNRMGYSLKKYKK
jgi:Rhodopirellula transposase DDE domain